MIEKDSLKVVYCYDLQLFAKDGPNGEKTEEPTSIIQPPAYSS